MKKSNSSNLQSETNDKYTYYHVSNYNLAVNVTGMEYHIFEDITKAEAAHVEQKLSEFADQFVKPRNQKEFGLVLRD